jgi:uncharacterized membrane protein
MVIIQNIATKFSFAWEEENAKKVMKDERKETKWHKTPSETKIEITAEDIYNYYFDLFKQKRLIGWLTSVEELGDPWEKEILKCKNEVNSQREWSSKVLNEEIKYVLKHFLLKNRQYTNCNICSTGSLSLWYLNLDLHPWRKQGTF